MTSSRPGIGLFVEQTLHGLAQPQKYRSDDQGCKRASERLCAAASVGDDRDEHKDDRNDAAHSPQHASPVPARHNQPCLTQDQCDARDSSRGRHINPQALPGALAPFLVSFIVATVAAPSFWSSRVRSTGENGQSVAPAQGIGELSNPAGGLRVQLVDQQPRKDRSEGQFEHNTRWVVTRDSQSHMSSAGQSSHRSSTTYCINSAALGFEPMPTEDLSPDRSGLPSRSRA